MAAGCRRYYLEIIGRRRVRLMEQNELDGYRVARVTGAPAAASRHASMHACMSPTSCHGTHARC